MGESHSSHSSLLCCSFGSLGRITMMLASVNFCNMPSPVATNVLPLICLFPIILIISLILLWTFPAFTAFATLLCKEQSFWREPILNLCCSYYFNNLGDDLIWHDLHCGFVVHHKHQAVFPLLVSWDPAKEVEDVLLLMHSGQCPSIRIGVCSSIVGSACCCWSWVEIVTLDVLIDLACTLVNITGILKLYAPQVFANVKDT